MRWPIGTLAVVAVVMAACGPVTQSSIGSPGPSSPSGTATPMSTATATPVASGPLAACLSAPQASSAAPVFVIEPPSGSEVELVNAEGSILNQTAIAQVPDSGPEPVAHGADGEYLFDPTTGELTLLGLQGPPEKLAQVTPVSDADDISLAESPNGLCWILSDTSWDSNQNATTKLYVGVSGGSPALLTTLTRANSLNGTYAGGYSALRWDSSGVLLGTDPTGVGGGGPFLSESYSLASVVRLNPVSLSVTASLCSDGRFADVAADGTLACLVGQNSDAQIVVTPPSGPSVTIDTDQSGAGRVEFATPSTLTYCTTDPTVPTDGAEWAETLWEAPIDGGQVAEHNLMSGDGSWCEAGAIVSGDSIAELTPWVSGTSEQSLVTIDLTTGQSTTITVANEFLGVL